MKVNKTTSIQITLSSIEAELLREILFSIDWKKSGRFGKLAEQLADELGDADVPYMEDAETSFEDKLLILKEG